MKAHEGIVPHHYSVAYQVKGGRGSCGIRSFATIAEAFAFIAADKRKWTSFTLFEAGPPDVFGNHDLYPV